MSEMTKKTIYLTAMFFCEVLVTLATVVQLALTLQSSFCGLP
jgi:hypothetical protein